MTTTQTTKTGYTLKNHIEYKEFKGHTTETRTVKGIIIDIDSDGKYLSVRNNVGNIDYIQDKMIIGLQ